MLAAASISGKTAKNSPSVGTGTVSKPGNESCPAASDLRRLRGIAIGLLHVDRAYVTGVLPSAFAAAAPLPRQACTPYVGIRPLRRVSPMLVYPIATSGHAPPFKD